MAQLENKHKAELAVANTKLEMVDLIKQIQQEAEAKVASANKRLLEATSQQQSRMWSMLEQNNHNQHTAQMTMLQNRAGGGAGVGTNGGVKQLALDFENN